MRLVGVAMRRALLALALAMAFVACGSSTKAQVSAVATAAPIQGSDWTRFNFDAQRSGTGPSSTGINIGNVGSLQRRVVTISGVADSSAVELHAISVAGRLRDVIFITTTYGKTLAIDPATGATLWQYVPGDIGSYLGSSQITTATPVVDPDRSYLYAA